MRKHRVSAMLRPVNLAPTDPSRQFMYRQLDVQTSVRYKQANEGTKEGGDSYEVSVEEAGLASVEPRYAGRGGTRQLQNGQDRRKRHRQYGRVLRESALRELLGDWLELVLHHDAASRVWPGPVKFDCVNGYSLRASLGRRNGDSSRRNKQWHIRSSRCYRNRAGLFLPSAPDKQGQAEESITNN